VRKMQVALPDVHIVADRLRIGWRGDTHSIEDVVALLALICPEHLCRALERALPVPAAGALPQAERLRETFRLEAELLALERLEESLVERACSDGLDTLRRVDASPAAVLGVAIMKEDKSQAA
jgi:hypothetical protein